MQTFLIPQEAPHNSQDRPPNQRHVSTDQHINLQPRETAVSGTGDAHP